MHSNRAFGPSSTISRNKYRYGDCVFSAEPSTGKVVFAEVQRPNTSGIAFVKTDAGHVIDLHDVSEQVIINSFTIVEKSRLGGRVVFDPKESSFNFWFREGTFATLTFSESDPDRGEQLLLTPESPGISLPCTVDELYSKLGEPDEVQLAK